MTRHTLDTVSLVFGLAFVALALAAMAGPLRLPDFRADLLLPLAAVVVGLGILASMRPHREGTDDDGGDVDDDMP